MCAIEVKGTKEETPAFREYRIKRFAAWMAAIAGFVALLPALLGWIGCPTDGIYLGQQYNQDDQMVYAAWMRQAMDGRFLFDNRFATDAQPGLTFQAYFLVLGWLAKLVSIPVAMVLARVGLSVLFVWLLSRLVLRTDLNIFTAKFALFMSVCGGGLGWVAWERFGQALVSSRPEWLAVPLKAALSGRAPIDVWQPEAFVFPSMLTNGLFMAALCLIVWVIVCVLDAKDSWRSVLPGAVAYGLLMNIHSYDALLMALVVVAFLAALLATRQASRAWAGRVAVIGCGAVPAALWFVYVLRVDPVFQARAATPTYAAGFQQVLFAVLPAATMAVVAVAKSDLAKWRRIAGGVGVVALVAGLTAYSYGRDPDAYLLSGGAWSGLACFVLALVAVLAQRSLGWNLLWAWALMGLIAPYLPALFQRKLAMGLMIPWGALGAVGLTAVLKPLEREQRNMVAALAVLIFAATPILWFQREVWYQQNDVSNTTVHPVYLGSDVAKILSILNADGNRKVVLAMPGVPTPGANPGEFGAPYIPDLNPICSGFTGAYTYAGHWSETPDYATRRNLVTRLFLAETRPEERQEILRTTGATYIVAPNPVTFAELPLADVTSMGESLYRGTRFELIRVAPSL